MNPMIKIHSDNGGKYRYRLIATLLSSLAVALFIACMPATSYAAPGDLDPSFGNGGKVIGWSDGYAGAVALQPDGKIVVAGFRAVARYNPDGTVDTSFGSNGRVPWDWGGTDFTKAIAVQPDGKIIVVGDGRVVRYNPDGSTDSTFGSSGQAYTVNDGSSVVAIRPDGRIVTKGYMCIAYDEKGYCIETVDTLIHLSPDGSSWTNFARPSIAHHAWSIAIQLDGKIVAAGCQLSSSNYDFTLVRYNTDGSLDTSFDDDGMVTTAIGAGFDSALSVVIQSDGKIVAAGTSENELSSHDFALVRYNSDGSLDTTLDSDGKVTTVTGRGYDTANSVAIEADGKIVVAGGTGSYNGSGSAFLIIRYNVNGSLDTTFGNGNGRTTVDFSNLYNYAYAMARDDQGRAVVAGGSSPESGPASFAIARVILGPGTQLASFDFDGDGRSDVSVFRPSDSIWYLDRSSAGFSAAQFGISSDAITPADHDDDRKTDIAVYRDGTWYWLNSSTGIFSAYQFGLLGDIPVPADYTGDGRDELAVYRNGQWWIIDLTNNQSSLVTLGLATDNPVAADYDGDGRADQAVYRNGEWFINRSSLGFTAVQFGTATDRPVAGDYDGDGRADIAVYRDGTWYLLQSSAGFAALQFGLSTDIPTPADYDGDGKTDVSVYRNGIWYQLQSSSGFVMHHFGLAGDIPVESAYSRPAWQQEEK